MFFNRIFSENVKRKMKEKTPRNQGFCDVNRGSGNWTRTSDIRINSYEIICKKIAEKSQKSAVF